MLGALEAFTRDASVDASINFEWLPRVIICLYVQINNQKYPLPRLWIETGFTWMTIQM